MVVVEDFRQPLPSYFITVEEVRELSVLYQTELVPASDHDGSSRRHYYGVLEPP